MTAQPDPTVRYRGDREHGLPKPMLFDGVVTVDTRRSDLVVKPASSARPWARVLWDEAVRTMAEESKTGGGHSAPTPWASFGGHDRFRYGIPDSDGTMRFRFYPDDSHYPALLGTPGLTARICLDRSNGRISVTFRRRRLE